MFLHRGHVRELCSYFLFLTRLQGTHSVFAYHPGYVRGAVLNICAWNPLQIFNFPLPVSRCHGAQMLCWKPFFEIIAFLFTQTIFATLFESRAWRLFQNCDFGLAFSTWWPRDPQGPLGMCPPKCPWFLWSHGPHEPLLPPYRAPGQLEHKVIESLIP